MENQLQKDQAQGTLSTLSDREKAIAKKLLDINLIVGYHLPAEDIVEWAKELEKLMPTEDLKKLPFILDCFKTTRIAYDNNLGIRNIFLALREVITDEDGSYRVRSQRFY